MTEGKEWETSYRVNCLIAGEQRDGGLGCAGREGADLGYVLKVKSVVQRDGLREERKEAKSRMPPRFLPSL